MVFKEQVHFRSGPAGASRNWHHRLHALIPFWHIIRHLDLPEVLDNTGNSAKVACIACLLQHDLSGALHMKNVYEVLRQKEMELTRLEKEVEALRLVAPLLSEEKET